MSMYVLQVLTGKELRIRDCLQDIGIDAYVPQEERSIRTGGRWTARLYTLIPSYVFVALDRIAADYYRIRQVTGIIRFLELNGGAAAAITDAEERMIRSACYANRPLPISHVRADGERMIPVDGPLKVYRDGGADIVYDRHRRRATVCTIDCIGKPLALSFEITNA